jgi:holliday junction DNA helicase RuvA
LQVKEDSHTLYGFSEKNEKEMFLLLISVSGVGAATARMMLSSLKSEEVRAAIVQGNTRLIESVKGIGKKTAERLILELRDKVGKKMVPSVSPGMEAQSSGEDDALNSRLSGGIFREPGFIKKI